MSALLAKRRIKNLLLFIPNMLLVVCAFADGPACAGNGDGRCWREQSSMQSFLSI